jgi:hypothetical protein
VALAAGLLSSNAQVYSANVVGYYNVVVPAKKFVFVADQLRGPGGNNSINTNFVNGFISDPTGTINSVLYQWLPTQQQFTTFAYYNAADAAPLPAGWYDLGNNLATISINQGNGCFIFNAANVSMTNTYVGEVVQGSLTVGVSNKFQIYSIVPPISTNIDSALVGFPSKSPGDLSGNTYDTYYRWLVASQQFTTLAYFNTADAAPTPAGWYDLSNVLQSTNASKWPIVGECFFIFHQPNPPGSPVETPPVTSWTSSFTVQ